MKARGCNYFISVTIHIFRAANFVDVSCQKCFHKGKGLHIQLALEYY